MTYSLNLKMKAVYHSEILADFQRTTRGYIQTIKMYITTAVRTSNPMGSLEVCDSFLLIVK
jgi:hypothetical protein